jgi:hypothetical protein
MGYFDRTRARNDAAREWKGGYRPYDIVKEGTIALGVVLALALVLTLLFSSPDERSSTIKSWSRSDPVDFVTTAASELNGTSGTAGYGPPYNHASDGQHIAFIYLQKWLGVDHPINTSLDYVINPLRSVTGQPALQAAVNTYEQASPKQQQAWANAYANALAKASVASDGTISMPAGDYGPVPVMMNGLLRYAQAGGLDGALVTDKLSYQTDYTKFLMMLADGSVLDNRAAAEHLGGDQWGMMNETGSFPGQSWLWLYTFWYQIQPFSSSNNADVLVMAIMGVLSLAFVLVPFIPGVRDLPIWIPVYKLVWREHYRQAASTPTGSTPPAPTQNSPPETASAAT